MKIEKEFECAWIYGDKGIHDANQLIQIIRQGQSFNPDLTIVIDGFPDRPVPQRSASILAYLSECIMKDLSDTKVHYLYLDNEFFAPRGAGRYVLDENSDFQRDIFEAQRIFVIMPNKINHYLYFKANIKGEKHLAYDALGRINSDASWIPATDDMTIVDHFLTSIIGYANPFPDQSGNGSNELIDFLSSDNTSEFMVNTKAAVLKNIERKNNAIHLAQNDERVIQQENGVIRVNAVGFGWFHTGTLVSKIKERYPSSKCVVITNDRGSIARNTKKWQTSIALIEAQDKVPTIITKLKQEEGEDAIKIASNQFFHLSHDAYGKVPRSFFTGL